MTPSSRIRTICRIFVFLSAAAFFAGGCAPTKYPPVELADQAPYVPEMADSFRQGRLEFIERQNAPAIPVRVFGASGSGIPVVMVHGLQSHSGWFAQSASFIAGLGMPVYAYDRSGSGLSTSKRGHCESYMEWIEELDAVWETTKQRHGSEKVHLVGHCFGAIPAAAFACEYPEKVASLVLSTPGIYTRKGVYFRDMVRIGAAKVTNREIYIPVRLAPEMFTDLPEYEKFIAEDNLALSLATAQFYYEVPKARRFIADRAEKLTMPVFMAVAEKDPICDNDANLRFFYHLTSEKKVLKTYADAEHILEYSRDREAFFRDLETWFVSRNETQETMRDKIDGQSMHRQTIGNNFSIH